MYDIFLKGYIPFWPTLSKSTFSIKSGYANPVPMESLMDKDSSGPNCFQIRSVVWLKIGGFHAKLMNKYQNLQSWSHLTRVSCVAPSCERSYAGCMNQACGCPSFSPSLGGAPFTQRHEILSRNTKDSRLSYGGNPKFLSHLVFERYQVVTPEQM